MKQYEKIARWIHAECDSPISEIEWLLEQIYEPSKSRVKIDFDKVICPKIDDDYGDLLDGLYDKINDKMDKMTEAMNPLYSITD